MISAKPAPVDLPLYMNNLRGDAPAYAIDGDAGSWVHPMFAHIVAPADEDAFNPYSTPDFTDTGIVCGACTDYAREEWSDDHAPVRHATVAHVRLCCWSRDYCEAEARAEAPLIRAGIL